MRRSFVVALSLTIITSSCIKLYNPYRTSCIATYGDATELIAYPNMLDESYGIYRTIRLYLNISNYYSSMLNQDMYKSLCEKNKDVSYNRKSPNRVFFESINDLPIVLTTDIADIKVATLDDYDEAHPAGSSLADIVQIQMISLHPFISSGYKKVTYNSKPPKVDFLCDCRDGENTTIYKKLGDVAKEDFTNVAAVYLDGDEILYAVLILEKCPSDPGKDINVEIVMTDGNGKVFSTNCVCSNDNPYTIPH